MRACGAWRVLAVAVGALSGWACPGGGEPPEPADAGCPDVVVTADGGVDAGLPRTVRGRRADRYFSETGEETVPVDLTGLTVVALSATGTGLYVTYPASRWADGTWEVKNVPAGEYYMRVGPDYVVTDADFVELVTERTGRSGTRRADAGTKISFSLSNLSPWQTDKDILRLASPNVGAGTWYAETILTPPIPDGGTTLSGVCDYSQIAAPILLEAVKGDTVWVNQFVSLTSDAGVAYTTVLRSFRSGPLDLLDGKTTTVTGAFTTVPTTPTPPLVWKRAALNDIGSRAGKNLSPNLPWWTGVSSGRVPVGGIGEYMLLIAGEGGAADVPLGSLAVGAPYPLGWQSRVIISADWDASLELPGKQPVTQMVSYWEFADSAVLTSGSLGPSWGPPTQLKVNGLDATLPLTQAGLMPVLSWGAPKEGPASGYRVVVYGLTANGAATTTRKLASFWTAGAALRLPPAIVQSGGTYYFTVTARRSPGLDARSNPWATPLPYAEADALSATFQP